MVHVDYGFAFGDSPGFNINFENVPFKLTREYVDLMGGEGSPLFRAFEDLFVRGFWALQRRVDAIAAIVEVSSSKSTIKIFLRCITRILYACMAVVCFRCTLERVDPTRQTSFVQGMVWYSIVWDWSELLSYILYVHYTAYTYIYFSLSLALM